MAKKQIITKTMALLVLLSMVASVVLSCTPKKEDKTNGSDSTNNSGNAGNDTNTDIGDDIDRGTDVPLGTEGLIFNSQTELKVVLADTSFPSTLSSNFGWAIKDNLGSRVTISTTYGTEVFEHEIVIGQSTREITKKAYSLLDDMMLDQPANIGGYILYSNGSSLALAYTQEIGGQHLEEIMAELTEEAQKISLVKKAGVVSSKLYDMYEIYAAEDKIRQDEAFAALAQKTNAEVAAAVRELYKSTYSTDIISWLANLYEPRNCICDNYVNGVQICKHPVDEKGNQLCTNGGFYYSNSARNTAGFLPDIESTYQALTFLEMTGMLSEFGNDFGRFIDGQLKSDIAAFVKGLQHPDGYFYHPQWTIDASRANWSRVSRDLMWAKAILSKFKAGAYYITPASSLRDGSDFAAPEVMLTGSFGSVGATQASKVILTLSSLPAHLQSVEAFEEYLSKFKLDAFGSGYYATNELAAQVTQLTTANKKLNGALKPVLFKWFEEKHRPDNGLWRPEVDYDSLNAVFKALMVYGAFRMSFPYADKAAESALRLITSSEVPGHVCGMYNTWYDIAGIISNIRGYHPDVENRNAIADGILNRIRELAPEAIRNTIKNTLIFRKEDGSFSYFEDHCSETSQGMPVALRKNEGDINASLICTGGMMDHISAALKVEMPPIFGTRQLAEFVDIINANGYSIKDELAPDIITNFEEDELEVSPKGVKTSMGSGGSCLVAEDPKNSKNKVLHFESLAKASTWDAITVPNNTVKVDSNCLVFEGKFMFAKEGTSQGYLVQFYIGNMGKPSPYFINFTIAGDYVEVWEGSSDESKNSFDRLIGKFKLDEWFKLRIEYYMGYEDIVNELTPHDTVRIKVYTNDKLVAVSSNYMDTSMKKFEEGGGTPVDEAAQALFFVMSYLECNAYLDDLYLGYKKIEYKNEKDTEGLIINEDADEERKTYDFDAGAPEDFTVTDSAAKIEFSEGALNFKSVVGESKITIPALNRKTHSNVFAVGFDIKIDSATAGNVFSIALKDPDRGETIATYTMRCAQTDGVLMFAPIYKGTTLISAASIPLDGSVHHIEFAFFVDQATTLIYLDGEMIASNEQGVAAKCFLYEMGSALITYSGKMVGSIDNLYCERRVMSFAEEVKPKVDRNLYDFSEDSLADIKGIETNGTLSDGKLSLVGGKYVTISVNNRAAYVSAHQLSLYIDTTKTTSDENLYVKYIDAEGKTIIGLAITVKEEKIFFYEMMGGVVVGDYIGSCKFKGKGTLVFNLFGAEKVLEAYVDDTIVVVTNVFNIAEYGDVAGATVSAQNTLVDNMYFDGLTITYTAPNVEGTTKDDTDEVITYEYSSVGNYPNRVAAGNSTIQNSTIEYVERDGELTKVFVLNKTLTGYSNGVSINFGDEKYHSNFVFATDMKLTGGLAAGGWRSTITFYFANQSGGTHLFIMDLMVDGGHLWGGLNGTPKVDCGAIPEDGWFNIRIEAKAGDKSTDPDTGAKFTLYINDTEAFTGNTVKSQEIGSIYQVMVAPTDGGTGTMYLDNTVLKHSN